MRVAVARWPDVPIQALKYYWLRLVENGMVPVDASTVEGGLQSCDGLLLTGGVDVDPALYGEARGPETDEPQRARDDFELALLRTAMQADIPVLAICRGLQLLNVSLGGSLLQHIESGAHVWNEDRTSQCHAVSLTPGRLQDILGGETPIEVNSRHHQAVTPERLAPGLKAAALSDDGLVEALESPAHTWVVAVQWHPERTEPDIADFDARSAQLFQAFETALRAHMSTD